MKTKAEEIFRSFGGQLKMSEAIKHGISRYMLYSMRDKGIIELVSKGVYRLAALPPISQPDFAAVSLRIPKAVICLVSALNYHEITTQVPHHVAIALPRDSRIPVLDYPPISAHQFSNEAYTSGIEEHLIDAITVKIYCPEKTLVDCFKYRNKIGIDVFLEALKLYKLRNKFKINELLKYAKICRVEKLIYSYLEAMQ